MATKDKLINLEDMKVVRDHDMAIVDNKADKVGSYPDLIAGTADNLVSSSYTEDSTPYLFRKTFAGVREDTEIVGGSVVWNQWMREISSQYWAASYTGDSVVFSDGVVDITASRQYGGVRQTTNAAVISGHKYLLGFSIKPTTANTGFRLQPANISGVNVSAVTTTNEAGVWKDVITIRECGATGTPTWILQDTRSSGWDAVQIKNVMLIDLTLLFGSTVADYIYSLETATAGAGVAFFRSLFDKPYYAYNAGTLMSVNTSAHKMVGFNQWDEEWENGYLSTSTGQNSGSSSAHYRSKNYIRVLPSGVYYFLSAKDIRVFMYRADKSYIDYKSALKNVTRTLADDCHYIRFDVPNGGNHEEGSICINFSSPRNGQYETYTAHTYPLDSSLTLRGLPKLDGDSIYYDGDIYKADGTVERMWTPDESLSALVWKKNGRDPQYYASVSGLVADRTGATIKCNKYVSGDAYNKVDKTICVTGTKMWVYDSSYTTLADFTASLTDAKYIAKLAEPTTEQAEPYTELQACDPNGTEEWVGANMPVGHDTKYYADLKGKIEAIPDAPSADGTYTLKVTVSNGVATYSWG